MQVDESRKPGPLASQVDSLVHYVMGELLRVVKTAVLPSAAPLPSGSSLAAGTSGDKPGPAADTGAEDTEDYFYSCVLMQVLAELVASYDSCKAAFIAFHKKRSAAGFKDVASKHRTSFLVFLINEIISPRSGLATEKAHRRSAFTHLANFVVASLCNDVVTPQGVKEASDELLAARKFVLDAVAKAMKDLPSSDPPDIRYAKLNALAELCTRLLTYRTATPNGVKEETSVHVAKIMLEKNFVSILTAALAEADLNHPSMKSLVGVIMRPLEQL